MLEGDPFRLTVFTPISVVPVEQQSPAGEALAAAIAFAGLVFAGAAADFAALVFPAAPFGAAVFLAVVAGADFAAGALTSTVTLTVVSTVASRPATWVSRRAAV